MIDYEKLKLMNLLLEKLSGDYALLVSWSKDTGYKYSIHNLNEPHGYGFLNIDDLIKKLEELTEPKPKYEVGKKVWLVDCDCICVAKIVKYEGDEYKISDCRPIDGSMTTGKDWAQESDLHPTKQALIEAQITYWQSLLKPECKHLNQSISMTGHTSGTNSCLDCKQEIPFQWSIDCNPKPKPQCDHEYQKTLDKSGMCFINMCHKCGHQYPIALLKPAVESVSKLAPTPYHRCPHGVICYETENVRMYCEICGNKPAKEECQHESDNIKYIMNPGSEGLEFPASRCKKCGEFYK
jgi:hypothetical protein